MDIFITILVVWNPWSALGSHFCFCCYHTGCCYRVDSAIISQAKFLSSSILRYLASLIFFIKFHIPCIDQVPGSFSLYSYLSCSQQSMALLIFLMHSSRNSFLALCVMESLLWVLILFLGLRLTGVTSLIKHFWKNLWWWFL